MNKSSMQNTSSPEDGKIVDQAKQAVSHVASNVASQAKEQVNAQFDTRKDKAVETIGNVATAIRETSDKLKGVGPLGDVAGRAADGIEKVADFFEGKQIGDVVRDVEGFARREPALFIGAAFALGLIGGRFLKSSAPRRGGSMGTSMGSSQYARSGAGGYGQRYGASAYGSSFADDQYDYLSDADLQDDVDSQRFGYGSQRMGRTTEPLGSRTGSPQTASGSSGSTQGSQGSSLGTTQGSQGSSFGTTQGSQGSSFGTTQGSPAGSSYGTSSGSGGSSGSSGTSTASTSTTSATTKPSSGGDGNKGIA